MYLEIQVSIPNIPKCFWVSDRVTMLLLKINEGWDDFWILREKITSWACLLGSGLKLIFHWKAQLFILFKSSFKFFTDKYLSNITEKRDVSSTNSLGFKTRFSNKSLIYTKKRIYWRRSLAAFDLFAVFTESIITTDVWKM